MNQTHILYLLIFFSSQLLGQDTSSVAEPNFIPIITYWNLNDTFEYTVTKESKKFDETGALEDSTQQVYNMKLVVADSTDSTYVIRVFRDTDWAEINEAIVKFNLKNKDLIDIVKVVGNTQLEYVIDSKGVFLETRNLNKFSKVFQIVFDRVAETESETEEQKKSMKAIFSKLSSTEYLSQKMLEEIKFMHKFYGLQYAQDSTWTFEQESPMPFAKEGVLVYKNTLLTTIPEDWGGLVRLQNNMTLDGDGLEKMIEGVFEETGKGAEISKAIKEANLSVQFYISYAIYPDTGQVESMYYEKSTYTGDFLKRIDTFFIGPP
jgi:hypothetical protein